MKKFLFEYRFKISKLCKNKISTVTPVLLHFTPLILLAVLCVYLYAFRYRYTHNFFLNNLRATYIHCRP